MVPRSSADEARARPPHQSGDGVASSAPTTSRVTTAGDLLPPMSGTAMTAASAISPLLSAGGGFVLNQLQVPHGRLCLERIQYPIRPPACRESGDTAVGTVK